MASRAFRSGAFAAALALCQFASAAAESYDYVIVGAGTCGLLLANRLSENRDVTVAVIDPGSDQRDNPLVKDPAQWLGLTQGPLDWAYSSVPQSHVENKTIAFPAGKGIGGTSLINGMTYIRGDKAQFDAWELLGNEGWNWDTMFEYYKQLEDFFTPPQWQLESGVRFDPSVHGQDGEVRVGFNPTLINGSLYGASEEGWEAVGQSRNEEVNNGKTEGFVVWPQTLDPELNVRWDAATAFFYPVEARENLKILNGTVTEVVWDPESLSTVPRATGVHYIANSGVSVIADAKKEVILSAGALRSSLILERSGVGNPQFLEELGIETVIDLPGVGENMIEQTNNALLYFTAGNETIPGYAPYGAFITAAKLLGEENVQAVAEETKARLADWAAAVAAASNGALSAESYQTIFEIQHSLIFDEDVTVAEILTLTSGQNVAAAYWGLLPFSRGSVHLTSSTDVQSPAIDPRFYQVNFDLDVQIATGRLASAFWATDAMSEFVGQPVAHLNANATEEEWRAFIIGGTTSNSHSMGTAAMMSRELGGVVDGEMRVYGAEGLRVVDASVIPMQFSGHMTATLYAIAQRASEMILSA